MLRRRAVVLVLAVVAPAGVRAGDGDRLFTPRLVEADQAASPSRVGVVRERLVAVAPSALDFPERSVTPLQPTVVLNFFDDASFRARLLHSERLERGRSWSGRVEGEPLSSVILVLYDDVLTGSVSWPGGSYRISHDGRGHVVEQLDHSRFPENGCIQDDAQGQPASAGGPTDALPAMADDGSLVEVLVAYTPASRAAAGGPSGIASLVNAAIAETNAGYLNSGVIQRVRLAGTVEVNGYTETDISTDLARLRSSTDGYMDAIHGLRNSYYADLVVLIGEGYAAAEGACGIAYLMAGNDPSFESSAFSVVDRTCATGYYSFGHEIGHNMGLNHARSDPIGAGAFSYSYGHKWTGYRTVMAYAPGTRILYFSNPDVLYGGTPTGVSETSALAAHNTLSLNNTRVTVANWRVSPPTTTLVDRYRLFSDITKEHHYTTDSNEYAVLGTRGWLQEGIAHRVYTGTAPASGVTPVPLYRLYNPAILQHLWTTDSNEYATLATRGWTQEGRDGYILPAAVSGTTTPLYRLYYLYLPLHLWTTDRNEYDTLATRGWVQEGVVGHVVP